MIKNQCKPLACVSLLRSVKRRDRKSEIDGLAFPTNRLSSGVTWLCLDSSCTDAFLNCFPFFIGYLWFWGNQIFAKFLKSFTSTNKNILGKKV